MTPTIVTARLRLRGWTTADRKPFAAMNADPEVMEHFPSTLSREESDAFVDGICARFLCDGFGLWALEIRQSGEFIGFTGLSIPGFEATFTPAVEIGWRLVKHAWGRGYASEAATAAFDFGFDEVKLSEVVSFTSVGNVRSRAVMRRLGMTHDPTDDFEHPNVPSGHHLRRHVLYRMSRDRWAGRTARS